MMSPAYGFEKAITIEELFDGRLECFGIYEEVIKGETSSDRRLLRKGCNRLWIYGDEFVTSFEYCGNSTAIIVDTISDIFDTRVVSDCEPQFWGFETEEELDRTLNVLQMTNDRLPLPALVQNMLSKSLMDRSPPSKSNTIIEDCSKLTCLLWPSGSVLLKVVGLIRNSSSLWFMMVLAPSRRSLISPCRSTL